MNSYEVKFIKDGVLFNKYNVNIHATSEEEAETNFFEHFDGSTHVILLISINNSK